MKRSTWILSALAALALVFAADYFFLHILFPLKKAAYLEEMNRDVDEHLRNEGPPVMEHIQESEPPPPVPPDNGSMTEENSPVAAANPASFQDSLKLCFGGKVSAANPQDLVQKLESRGVISTETALENWHVVRPNGEEERIMVVPSDRENARGRKEVRLFGVDEEGLPVPKVLPRVKAFDPKEEFIASLKTPGRLVFHQKQEAVTFRDGSSASIEWQNEHIRDLQVFLPEKTLSCRDLNCRCL